MKSSMRRRLFLFSLLLSFFVALPIPVVLHASLVQEQVPISVTTTTNISQGLIYMTPLPQQVQLFGNNYYVANSIGYYEYSYLFSSTPPLLVWYEPAPTTQTYYFVYGGNTQASAVTTGVFSFYSTFYYVNRSIFNVSNANVLGGVLVLNGQNSLVTFNTSAYRYTSAMMLYNFQSEATVTPPTIIFSGSIPPGSIVTLSLLQYSQNMKLPPYIAYPFATTYMSIASDTQLASQQFTLKNGVFNYNGSIVNGNNQMFYSSTLPSSPNYILQFSSSVSLVYPTAQYLASQTAVSPLYVNGTIAISQNVETGQNAVVLQNPTFFYNPTLLNGSNVMVYNGTKWYQYPVSTSSLKLDVSHTTMYVLQSIVNSSYLYFYDIPLGSSITLRYSNGSTYSFTASGPAVNTIGPLSLVNVKAYGIGVVGISIQPSVTNQQVSFSGLAGFTDFLHKAGVLFNGSGVYVYNGNKVVTTLTTSPSYPADVGAGYVVIGNTFYLVGFYYSAGSFYPFVVPLPYAVASTGIVPYVNYNGTVPLALTDTAVTISTGFYYEATGLVSVVTGLPSPIQSAVLSVTTTPGVEIVNKNGNIYQTQTTNQSAPLVLVGFQGYNLVVQYGNIQSQLIVTSNYYPTNLPTDLQIVITASQATRTVAISTSPLPVKPVAIGKLNVTNATASTPPGTYYLNNYTLPTGQLLGITTYYAFLALAIVSYRYSNRLWSSTLFMSFSTISMALLFGEYIVIAFAVGSIVLGFIFKKLDI